MGGDRGWEGTEEPHTIPLEQETETGVREALDNKSSSKHPCLLFHTMEHTSRTHSSSTPVLTPSHPLTPLNHNVSALD